MPRKAKVQSHRGVYEKHKGSGIWWIRYTALDGKRKAESVGSFGAARDRHIERVKAVREGIIEASVPRRGARFSELVQDALQFSESNHGDIRNFKQRLELAEKKFKNRVAESITPNELSAWLAEMQKIKKWQNGTYNRVKAAISKAFKLGVANRKVTQNPVRSVPQKKESIGRVRFLSDEEEIRLKKALVNRSHCLPQLEIALNTGMRKGEQFSVTWNQIDFERKTIFLDRTKNGSSRHVMLNSEALRTLEDLKSEHEKRGLNPSNTLFLDRKNQPIRDPREWFANATSEAGISGMTWHILRHTFASRLVMKGVDLKTVQELMGHKTIAMTARYAHLSESHKFSALERLVSAEKGK